MFKTYNKNFYGDVGDRFIPSKNSDGVFETYISKHYRKTRMIITSPDFHKDFFESIPVFVSNCADLLESSGILCLILGLDGASGDKHRNLSNILDVAYIHGLKFWNFGLLCCGGLRLEILFFTKYPHNNNNIRSTTLLYYGDDYIDLDNSDMFPFKQLFLGHILQDFTKEGQLICDPFMGTSSVLEWCKNNDRDFIGWEKDKERYNKIVEKFSS